MSAAGAKVAKCVVMGRWQLLCLTLLMSVGCMAQHTPPCQPHPQLRVGAEMLLSKEKEYAILPKATVAVVANQSSLVGSTHLVDTLLREGVKVVRIFCPEHGFRGTVAAGGKVDNSIDPKTGLPIISLYGNNKKPAKEQLRDVDVVIFDLQDVGCRFYTYLSTLHYVMEACAEDDKPLLVLDRPNPNGHYIDGPVLDTARYRSFVGMHPVPIVYGMTIGEYACMINGEHWLADGKECKLTVVAMQNYFRDSVYALPVPPSPNLRNAHAIALYPSLCLFEGTNVSVGRGTDWPFEVIGTPYSTRWSSDSVFGEQSAPAIAFTPKGGKQCFGINLRNVRALDCVDLGWLEYMYSLSREGRFFLKNNFFEMLAGTADLRRQLNQHVPVEEIRASWQPQLEQFKAIRTRYLLYPDIEEAKMRHRLP